MKAVPELTCRINERKITGQHLQDEFGWSMDERQRKDLKLNVAKE